MSSIAIKTQMPPAVESKDVVLSRIVERAFAANGYMPLDVIEVNVHEGFVTLKGRVPSYYLKQMAQTAIIGHDGIERIQNEIEVVSTGSLCRKSYDT